MPRYKILLILLLIAAGVSAQTKNYMFRIYLNDKGSTSFSIENPQEFLSQKSIERREKQNIGIDQTDLPISAGYIADIESLGCTVVAKSKWLSTVSICCDDSLTVELIKDLSFVKKVAFVWRGTTGVETKKKTVAPRKSVSIEENNSVYGAAYKQIAVHNGDYLHDLGYKGQGMEIAVIDAGFNGLDEDHLLLSTANIKGAKDFVYKGTNMYQSGGHGTFVLSCMATNASDTYIGTAPKAGYWLLRSEDSRSEFPIEEDYWATAAEYADSLGVDLINSSLGYSTFNLPELSYTYNQMNGKIAYITQASEMAVSKGIFVVSSAGNEGDKAWKYITAPADGEYTFTVGAIKPDSTIAAFSSRGPTIDGRIKPDVMAVGDGVMIVNASSQVISSMGTSFSSPVMCGLAACFWQANPQLTNKEIAAILRQSADRYANPDNNFGYGIPDLKKAMELASDATGVKNETLEDIAIKISTDSTTGGISVIKEIADEKGCSVNIYSIDGKMIISDTFYDASRTYNLDKNRGKIFIVRLAYNNKVKSHKVCL